MGLFSRRRSAVLVRDSAPPARFRFFGGRRHLDGTPYPLPKDLAEINRLDFQHYLLRTGFRGNYAAPIERPDRILDVGCGSGRWAMELAAQFPQAQVTGLDLTPPPADDARTLGQGLDRRPANYSFAQGNVLEGLPFGTSEPFDFVHQRLLITAIPADRWPFVIGELTRVTKRGGWVELAECGVPEHGGPGLTGLWQSWIALCGKRNVDFTMGHTLGDLLSRAGLQHVDQRVRAFPMGAYGGRVGQMSATDCLAVGQALRGGAVAARILSEAQYDRLYQLAQAELSAPKGTGVLPFYVACGQRPA